MEKQEIDNKEKEATLIRILATDIPGDKKVYCGLTMIKGISWAMSNAICRKLKINKKQKIEELGQEGKEKILQAFKELGDKDFLLNRRKDYDSGEDKHLLTGDLDLQKDFDIKRLKKSKCYRGERHSQGLPVRGQRTKSNFRKNRKKGGGISKATKK